MARPEATIARAFDRAGWVLVRSRKHQIWRCPCRKHTYTMAHSLGRGRALNNTIQQIKRLHCPAEPDLGKVS